MKLDNQKLHKDILKKLNAINKSQRELTVNLKISRSTIFRISKNKPITMKSFIIILDWLYYDANRYINRKFTKHRTKRSI